MKLRPGKEIFKSKYYEGHIGNHVTLHFESYKDYNDFLSWWVLGKSRRKFKQG